MIRTDWTKLVVALAVIAGTILLLALDRIEDAAGLGLIGTVVGYILGNGKSVATGDRPGTMLTRVDLHERRDDRDEQRDP